MTTRVLTAFALVLLLTACATSVEESDWPDNAYPRAYFIEAFREDAQAQQYQEEEDYLLWVTRFYRGFSIAPGWHDLTQQVKDRIDESRHEEVGDRLYHLGGRIGSEWAKASEVRLLNTRNASVWRDALIESINQGDLDEYITRVEDDVEAIMAGELSKEDIYFERYYIDEFDF